MTFRNGQRVQIVAPMNDLRLGLKGLTGVVVRLLMRSSREAWVDIDGLPKEFQVFVDEPRKNHILLDKTECLELKS